MRHWSYNEGLAENLSNFIPSLSITSKLAGLSCSTCQSTPKCECRKVWSNPRDLKSFPVEVRRFESCLSHQSDSIWKKSNQKALEAFPAGVRRCKSCCYHMDDKHQNLMDSINAGIEEEIKKTWASGHPITIGKDGEIIQIYPNGCENVIGTYEKCNKKFDKIYHLK